MTTGVSSVELKNVLYYLTRLKNIINRGQLAVIVRYVMKPKYKYMYCQKVANNVNVKRNQQLT